jgi:hypothetical protein
MAEFLKRQLPSKKWDHPFLNTEFVGVISEFMWILIIITLLALIGTLLM